MRIPDGRAGAVGGRRERIRASCRACHRQTRHRRRWLRVWTIKAFYQPHWDALLKARAWHRVEALPDPSSALLEGVRVRMPGRVGQPCSRNKPRRRLPTEFAHAGVRPCRRSPTQKAKAALAHMAQQRACMGCCLAWHRRSSQVLSHLRVVEVLASTQSSPTVCAEGLEKAPCHTDDHRVAGSVLTRTHSADAPCV